MALEQLLTDVKNKIRSLHKSKKSCRCCWLVKKARNDFKANLYIQGKTLPDTKCYVNLKGEQADFDQHKSSSHIDINYNIPSADLEYLPDQPFPTKVSQLKISFKYCLQCKMH